MFTAMFIAAATGVEPNGWDGKPPAGEHVFVVTHEPPMNWKHADTVALAARLDTVAPRWLGFVRDVERRRAWGDRLVDALCDPPESFVLGSVLAHVLTYSAQRRGLARALLHQAGVQVGDPVRAGGPPSPEHDGDPIEWLRRR
jgi:AraC family transcriptional regulator